MSNHTLGESHFLTLSDGRKLHYRRQGSGELTLVFESGMGFSSAVWGLVQPEIAKEATVMAYDRAGIGKSDWDDEDRTIDRIADDLEQLLHHLGGPLMLVGYSWGGPIVRRVAARRTSDVQGIVLLDQVDENNPDYFTEVKAQSNRIFKLVKMWFMHAIGLRLAALKVFTTLPADCRREIIWRDLAWKGARIANEELRHIVPGLQQMLGGDHQLAGIDVTVISGTDPELMSREYRPSMVQAHEKTARELDRGRLVKADSSAHFTPVTQPKLVIREIRNLINLVRQQEDKHKR